ncbi:MAG: ADP-dependent glucokinase/phosphofructokinase [Candidatus Micrarchaeota archaeon]
MVQDAILERVWSAKLRTTAGHTYSRMRMQRVFCAFNAITDAVVQYGKKEYEAELKKCDRKKIGSLQKNFSPSSVETKEEFFACFLDVFSRGKALEIPCHNPKLFEWFKAVFREEIRMGGQAGIISNQLSQLQVNTVCYSPILSRPQSRLFYKENLYFPKIIHDRLVFKKPRASFEATDPTKTNWIFEFKKGDAIRFQNRQIVCPRSNRLIVASRPAKYEPVFAAEIEPHLQEISGSFDVFFLAGFQSFQHKMDGRHFRNRLQTLIWQLKLLRQNKRARFHIEYVAIHDPYLDKIIYPRLLQFFDSLGINEVETIHFLRRMGDRNLSHALERHESPHNYYRAILRIFHKYKLKRLHAHTLGYFLLLLRKDYAGRRLPSEFVNSMLFASSVADARALFGKAPFLPDLKKLAHLKISDIGIDAMKAMANALHPGRQEAERFMLNGIYDAGDHWLIMVPTAIVKPKATVGLGDTISSVSFASEPF